MKLYSLVFMLLSAISLLHLNAQTNVTVRNGRFYRDDHPYYFIGTNMWYAPILASDGDSGNLERLRNELDTLCSLGINNIRLLAGAEAGSPNANSVVPVLQDSAGHLNEVLLRGLDRLLIEMEQRHMTAVIYLTNAWDWSGGFGYYLNRCGKGASPASDGENYSRYVEYASQFSTDTEAQRLYFNFVRRIVGRTNSINGCPYRDSHAIMSWQLCNEPRPFTTDSAGVEGFIHWLTQAATIIKQIDPNHLVSVGSEGIIGCNVDETLYTKLHSHPSIDYLTLHIWPINWRWSSPDRLYDALPNVYVKSEEYIIAHERIARKLLKPMVIEEFGYARDHNFRHPLSHTNARDNFLGFIFNQLTHSANTPHSPLMGCNFWGWGGSGRPGDSPTWHPGEDFLTDPPHEPQGWYSVYDSDASTLHLIKHYTEALGQSSGVRE